MRSAVMRCRGMARRRRAPNGFTVLGCKVFSIGDIASSDLIASSVVGVATGVISAFIVWWYLTRWLRPRCVLNERLGYYSLDEEPVARSQVGLRSGTRTIIDCNLTISLRIPGLVRAGSTELLRIYRTELPLMRAHTRRLWRVSIHEMPPETYGRFYPWLEPWRDAIEEKRAIDVKEFLRSYPGSRVVVTFIAHDAFTGSTAAVRQSYGESDFEDGGIAKYKRVRLLSWLSPGYEEAAPDRALLAERFQMWRRRRRQSSGRA